jgi:hypothetical protein
MPHQEGSGKLAQGELPPRAGLVHSISHSDLQQQQPEQKRQKTGDDDRKPVYFDMGPLLLPNGPTEALWVV